MKDLSDNEKLLFQAEYAKSEKKPLTGQLFAFFLGGFGGHHFYMGNTGLGFVYILFSWTGLSALAALIEIFLMRGRCKEYNETVALEVSTKIKAMRSNQAPIKESVQESLPEETSKEVA
ncbi:MAG: NINE protein [Oligoflexia bacterium]|nr:NINE protein [Oligoflexia bacterium]